MLSKNAIRLLKERYIIGDEAPKDVFKRVATTLAIKDPKLEKQLYTFMTNGTFLPNSPCIRNAGRKHGLLHACFVLGLEDSIDSIFETVRHMAIIFKQGGGIGVNFSKLRPNGAPLDSGGTSSGAVSFMNIFNVITETVKQGGFRRGALMGVLNPSHPEILDFCRAKLRGNLTNFNLSVMATDDFMTKATNGGTLELTHNDKLYATIRAKDVLDIMTLGAWAGGDPGILFYDRINKDNKLLSKGITITATNPCGEVPLPEGGACCLGSINIAKFVKGNNFKFDKFAEAVKIASRALLHMNLISSYPLPKIKRLMEDLNPIGVGIMGFADTLIMLGIKYDSDDCLKFIEDVGRPYIDATEYIAKGSFYKRIIAPTGSLSILADCSSGIEPIFARSFERQLVAGTFVEGKEIYKSKYAIAAHEISPDWHLKVQAKWQEALDGSVSKTINCPANTSVDEIKDIYINAWKMGCKGVTVFRDGSIEGVLKANTKCEGGTCSL